MGLGRTKADFHRQWISNPLREIHFNDEVGLNPMSIQTRRLFYNHIIRVNLSKKSVSVEKVQEYYELIGGRGLVAKILHKETDPLCDPLSGDNKLII